MPTDAPLILRASPAAWEEAIQDAILPALGCPCLQCQAGRFSHNIPLMPPPAIQPPLEVAPMPFVTAEDLAVLPLSNFTSFPEWLRRDSVPSRSADEPDQEPRAYIPRAVRNDWRTPDPCLVPVRATFGGEIGLDPCASTEHWLSGGDEIGVVNFHEEDDGLARNWFESLRSEGAITTAYVNPPFNRNKDWMRKCAEEAARGVEVIALIPARTDTRYWQGTIARTAQAICFWRGRIRFVGAEQGAPFPCAFIYWGHRPEAFANAFADYGQVLYTANPVAVTRSENVPF
jgi:hypothetical protein